MKSSLQKKTEAQLKAELQQARINNAAKPAAKIRPATTSTLIDQKAQRKAQIAKAGIAAPKAKPAAIKPAAIKPAAIKPAAIKPAAPKAKPAAPKAKPAIQKPAKVAATAPATGPTLVNGIDITAKYGTGKTDTLPTDYQALTPKQRLDRLGNDDAKLAVTWKQIATFYGWSVTPWIAELFASKDWPAQLDKDGKATAKPMPYKNVYKSELDAGLKGIGHIMNVASNQFSRSKPDELKRTANTADAAKPATDPKKSSAPSKPKLSHYEQIKELVLMMNKEEIIKFKADAEIQDHLAQF